MHAFAIIFDMDGTLLDNNPYHLQAWKKFYEAHGRTLSDDEYLRSISGLPNSTIISRFFGGEIGTDEITRYMEEKEAHYRALYAPHIRPIDGLIAFLKKLQDEQIPAAIATSAIKVNIDFAMNALGLWNYFDAVIDTSMVSKGKPDPEIYLKCASALDRRAAQCVVIEDSLAGIKGANAAGMKVVAITTAHTAAELQPHDLAISDYNGLEPSALAELF
ncbi:MAG: HAD family phosphatase [Mucilaginibacter polytrichastri]|nr:HAD family phosphatase [Mucilaginibacter polytrichastri]